ncbi:hypothetical protein LAZ67_15000961 [Cordylochernes scorpioides]|uniref:Uncharacterized protein n=1 Tax=Cordylochernes scorpioides TaxID=51811 RepID=A0ABY6L9H1_9ARAC|nr:hypothetical protein LAZ67_15000961 [Cordylochernes scorpioides]
MIISPRKDLISLLMGALNLLKLVLWFVSYLSQLVCVCTMKLGSWIFDGLQVDVTNRTTEVDLSNYVPNGEWELMRASLVRNVVFYSCCREPFPDVTVTLVIRRKMYYTYTSDAGDPPQDVLHVTLVIRRKTLYYMYNVVMPCMMMSVLTLLVFCLPPDTGEKIALGVTVLLAFSVFMLAIAEKMPETSESIPLLGRHLLPCVAFGAHSLLEQTPCYISSLIFSLIYFKLKGSLLNKGYSGYFPPKQLRILEE